MVRSKKKLDVPSEGKRGHRKGAQCQLSKAVKRQKELDTPLASSPSSNSNHEMKQYKTKFNFSQIKSAFATYAKDKPTSPLPVTKRPARRKSDDKAGANPQSRCNRKRGFGDCSISEKSCKTKQPSVTCPRPTVDCEENIKNNDSSSIRLETSSPQSHSIRSPLKTRAKIDKIGPLSSPSKNWNKTVPTFESPENRNNSSSTASSELEIMDGTSEYEVNEEMLDPNEQAKCDEYAETNINFRSAIKSQSMSNLPEVVVIPIKDKDQALVGFNESLNLYGCATIKVMRGAVSVYGCVMSPKESEVTFYSPLYDPALVIQSICPIESEADVIDEQSGIENLIVDGVLNQDSEAKNLMACSIVILMSALKASHMYPKYKNLFDAPPQHVSYYELCKGCFLVGPNCVFIDFPGYHQACREILSQAEVVKNQPLPNNAVVVTVGSKGAGKSTFNRYLVNCLLNHYEMVNYIDCDIGQPEFTISGCISLNWVTSPILGPPFTHLKSPHFSIYYGALNASHDVDRYVENVRSVMHHVKRGYPVVVNTMGWIKDIGMNLLADIIRMIQPTYVVQLSSRREVRTAPLILKKRVDQFESLKFPTTPPALDYKHFWIKTDLPTSNLMIINPADRRLLRTFSYFSQVQNECALKDLHRVDKVLSLRTLCSLKPYIVFVKDVLLCVCHETGVLRRYALSVFNCAIVSLSAVSKKHFEDHSKKKYLEAPPASKCYGFGIVRGVDPHKKALFIISNLPRDTLLGVNCLSIGSLTVPEALYNTEEARSMDATTMPYVVEDFPFHITGSNRFRSYKTFK